MKELAIKEEDKECRCERQKYSIFKLRKDIDELKKNPESFRHFLKNKGYGSEELLDLIEIFVI